MIEDAEVGSSAFRALRKHRNISQQQLADRSGLSVRTIRALERGAKSSPRFSTVDRALSVLAPDPESRYSICCELGLNSEPFSVLPEDILPHSDRDEDILKVVRANSTRYNLVYFKRTSFVSGRVIQREVRESVIKALKTNLKGLSMVVVSDSPEAAVGLVVDGRAGCKTVAYRRIPRKSMTVVDIEFDRALSTSEAYSFTTELVHRESTMSVRGGSTARTAPSPDPYAGRVNSVGMHNGTKLGVIEAQFDPADLPAQCCYVYERRLDGGFEHRGDVVIEATGRAQLVLADASAGWHGIAWSWPSAPETRVPGIQPRFAPTGTAMHARRDCSSPSM